MYDPKNAPGSTQPPHGVPVLDKETEATRPETLAIAGWGFVGFVIGAVFWHFIGFWGFVSNTVLNGAPPEHRHVAQTGFNCSEFAIDRTTGQTKPVPCPFHAPELADIARSVRSDSERFNRLKKMEFPRWSIQISQEEATPGE